MKRRDVMKVASLALTPLLQKVAMASVGNEAAVNPTQSGSKTSEVPNSADNAGLAALGVAAAAAAIRKGEISSEAYASALLQRAKTYSDLDSFITIEDERVLSAARAADKARAAGATAPLLGVPIGIKDSYFTQGLRTTLGIANLKSFVPDHDAGSVKRIKSGGGVIFGKNNLVELSYGLTGNNKAFGQVKNPHDRSRVTGGSSSGSGASVAARLVPASLGGDTIGSIRVPASLCGVVGFKPTTGRWPRDGVAPISHTLDTTGVFARSVEDCILIDQVVTGDANPSKASSDSLKGVKLAYAPRQYLELVDPEVEAQFKETVYRLRSAGAEIIEVDLGKDFAPLALETTWDIFFRETKPALEVFLRENKVPVTFDEIYRDLKPELKEAWGYFVLPEGGGYITESRYEADLSEKRAEVKRRFDRAFIAKDAQALLLPATPTTAPLIDTQYEFAIAGKKVSYMTLANNTIPASAVGLPSLSLPIGLSSNKMPIGLGMDGPLGRDKSLLNVARRVEAVVGALSSPV